MWSVDSYIFSTRPACSIAPACVGYFVVGPGSSVVVAAVGSVSVGYGWLVAPAVVAGVGGGLSDCCWLDVECVNPDLGGGALGCEQEDECECEEECFHGVAPISATSLLSVHFSSAPLLVVSVIVSNSHSIMLQTSLTSCAEPAFMCQVRSPLVTLTQWLFIVWRGVRFRCRRG